MATGEKTGLDKFRGLLDERGVKHVGVNGAIRFTSKYGCECRAYGLYDVTKLDVTMRDVTPEQVIAATLVNDGAAELQAENDKLKVEGDKLRELIRDMWHELDEVTQYDAKCSRSVVFEFKYAMRDLGIEVVNV